MESTITIKGQVTLSKAVRDHLHLSPGDRVKFFVDPDGHLIMLPKRPITALRYFAQDDEVQSPIATHLLHRRLSEEEPGFISLVALVELIWVLTTTHKFTSSAVLQVLEHMLQASSLVLQQEPAAFAAFLRVKKGRGSFPDALIAEINARAGCSVTLSFDKGASRHSGFKLR